MRKLLVRERVFAIGAKFDISDEDGNSVFLVEADKFDIGKIYMYIHLIKIESIIIYSKL